MRVSGNLSDDDVFAGEETAFLKLAEIIATLQQQSARVKVEGLKDSVEKAMKCLNIYKTAREVLQAEWKSRIQIAVRDVADSQTTQQVKALESKVTKGLHRIDAKLSEKGGVLASLRDTKDGSNNVEDKGVTWTEVTRRGRAARSQATLPSSIRPSDPVSDAPPKTVRSARLPRPKPLAIMDSNGKDEFLKLLKTVKKSVNPEVTGNLIAKMRTLQGNLLIEINGGAEAAEKVRQEMTRSLGANTSVRRMGGETPLEICDLDELTDKEKILAAVALAADGSVPRLVSHRRTHGGAQIAVVVLPTPMARRLCAAGRIRVGLVYARVRQKELLSRCYRCLAFGHIARECTGLDRSDVCWRCGVTGPRSELCGVFRSTGGV